MKVTTLQDYTRTRPGESFSTRSVKVINKLRILQHLYWNSGETQLGLSHKLHLSSPTITQALQQFKERGLVVEGEEVESSGGRKPRRIEFHYGAMHAAGVEIRKHHVGVLLADLAGRVVAEGTHRLPFENTPAYWRAVNAAVRELAAGTPAAKRVLGVGVAFPGEVAPGGGSIQRATVLGIENEPLEDLRQYFDYPVLVENAADTAGFGAVWLSHGMSDAVYLIVTDSGIAGSIIIDNRIFRGSTANTKAGAFGHMVLNPQGKQCFCGGRGCWSIYCALSSLYKYTNDDLQEFFARLEAGDVACSEHWDEYLAYFAQALANIKLGFDMDIIIGGKIAPYLQRYLPDLEARVRAYPALGGDGKSIRVDSLDGSALAVGAALMFVDKLLSGQSQRYPVE